jgi:hypothetical protein
MAKRSYELFQPHTTVDWHRAVQKVAETERLLGEQTTPVRPLFGEANDSVRPGIGNAFHNRRHGLMPRPERAAEPGPREMIRRLGFEPRLVKAICPLK